MLLCACAIAPGAARAQASPPAQPPETAPVAAPAVPTASAAPPGTAQDTTAAPASPSEPAAADTTAAPHAAQPAPAAQPSSDADATQTPVTTPPPPTGLEGAAAETAQPPAPTSEGGAAAEAGYAGGGNALLPWSAALIWRQGYVVAGLDRNAYQSFNPTYTWTFLAFGVYRFDKKTSLSLIQPATVELTDSATTSTRQELWFLDTILELSHTFYEMEPVKDAQTLKLSAGAGASLPLSKASQAEGMIFAPRVRGGASYEFRHVLGGLGLGADMYYSRRLLTSNTLAATGPYSCATVNETLSHPCTRLDSFPSTQDELLAIASADLGVSSKLHVGLQLWFYWDHSAELATATFTDPSGGTNPLTLEDGSTTHWHNSRLFTTSVSYAFTEWFTGGLRVTNTFNERSPNGELRAPLNPLDTLVGVDLSVSFDKLYMSTRGHGGS
jgi:hypothetical protein